MDRVFTTGHRSIIDRSSPSVQRVVSFLEGFTELALLQPELRSQVVSIIVIPWEIISLFDSLSILDSLKRVSNSTLAA